MATRTARSRLWVVSTNAPITIARAARAVKHRVRAPRARVEDTRGPCPDGLNAGGGEIAINVLAETSALRILSGLAMACFAPSADKRGEPMTTLRRAISITALLAAFAPAAVLAQLDTDQQALPQRAEQGCRQAGGGAGQGQRRLPQGRGQRQVAGRSERRPVPARRRQGQGRQGEREDRRRLHRQVRDPPPVRPPGRDSVGADHRPDARPVVQSARRRLRRLAQHRRRRLRGGAGALQVPAGGGQGIREACGKQSSRNS